MGRTAFKEYKFVTEITENWIKTAYPQQIVDIFLPLLT